MPILSGGLIAAPVDDPVDPGEQPIYHEAGYGNMAATWIDPDGTSWDLSNDQPESPWFTMDGPAGWQMPPVELVTDPLPRGGEQLRFVRMQPKTIHWPIYIGDQSSHENFTGYYRQLVKAIVLTAIDQKPGYLRVARPNGRYRQIACVYQEGLEGEAGENYKFAKPTVTFWCPDGFWSSDRATVAARDFVAAGAGGATSSFYTPFMKVGSSKVLTGSDTDPPTVISNPGDVMAWPTWKIVGPMTKLTARNDTTGGRFALTYNLAAGQTINITTNRPSVRGPGDAVLTKYVDWFNAAGTELWPLQRGNNNVFFQIDGAGTGTHVEMSFVPRYATA